MKIGRDELLVMKEDYKILNNNPTPNIQHPTLYGIT